MEAGLTLLSASSGVPNILAFDFVRQASDSYLHGFEKPRTRGLSAAPLQRRRKGRDKAVGILRIGLDSSTCACCFLWEHLPC